MSSWGGIFDYGAKAERLEEVELELGAPDVWENQDHAQKLGKERASLELVVETIRDLSRTFDEISELDLKIQPVIKMIIENQQYIRLGNDDLVDLDDY